MLHHRHDRGKPVWEEWHRMRQRARTQAHSLDEFSDREIEAYDLDEIVVGGAGNPDHYDTHPPAGAPSGAERNISDARDDPRR